MYSMALVGEFNTQSDLFDWQNTPNYIEANFMKCGTMVAAMDELKNEMFRSEDFARIFNMLYGGSTKGRLTQSAAMTGDVKIRCSTIVTSEAEPTVIPESVASRITFIRVARSEESVARERKRHMDVLDEPLILDGRPKTKKCLLHGLFPRMVAWEQRQSGRPYGETLEKWCRHYSALVVGQKNTERAVHMTTRLVSAFERICRFMVEMGYVTKRDAEVRLNEFVEYWDGSIAGEVSKVKERSSGVSVAKILVELIRSGGIETGVFDDMHGWKSIGNINNGVVLLDVTYPDIGRKILIVSQSRLFKKFRELTNNTAIEDRFMQDGLESGLIDKIERKAPPGSKFLRDEDSATFVSIDYNRLMADYIATRHTTND